MSIQETEEALKLTNERIKALNEWLIDNHESDYAPKIYGDICDLEMEAENLYRELELKQR